MSHETALVATIAAGIGLALLLGFGAVRVGLPPLVGYLLAGMLVGPHTPGFVADVALAQQLAEIGVILLMFGVGIHFSLADLLAARRIALPGALVQITVATGLGAGLCRLWGWSWAAGAVFGLCLSVASTVVLLRALEDRNMLDSDDGRVAVGWLIVEDLVTVLVLVLLPALAITLGGEAQHAGQDARASADLWPTIGLTVAKVAAFVALMLIVGRRAVPWLLWRVARTGSRELFTLSVLAVALGIAVGAAALFGVSFALGAFFAGMVVNSSKLSHEAASDALPLQDAFSVLFFVAVGMLFDPSILLQMPLELLSIVLIVMVGKSLAAFFIVVALRRPVGTALTISASLAQIGEFSFILAALAVALGLLPAQGQSLIVAGALISIALNPLAFAASARIAAWIGRNPRLVAVLEHPTPADGGNGSLPSRAPQLRDHVILIGYGRVGSVIGQALAHRSIPYTVIEQDRVLAASERDNGVPIVYGDATRARVLQSAGVERARLLVLATPDPYRSRAVLEAARSLNPQITAVARSHGERERSYLEGHGVELVLIGEHELAVSLAHHALMRLGVSDDDADDTIGAIRDRFGAVGASGG